MDYYNSEILNQRLKEVPYDQICDYIKIRIEKMDVLKQNRYSRAAELRDLEKELISEYPNLSYLSYVSTDDIKLIMRDFLIYLINN